MKRKQYFISILVLILFLQPFLVTNTTSALATIDLNDLEVKKTSNNLIVKKDIGAGGEEQLITNVARNGGFEEASTYDEGPEYFSYYANAFQYTDRAYTVITHGGSSYACSIQGLGSGQFYSNPYLYKSFTSEPERAYLQENIDFDFFYYLVNNPDILSGGTIYLRLRCYHDASSTGWDIYYYFSIHNFPSSNDTWDAYYDLTSPFGSWEAFSRDITNDFSQAFGPAPADTYVSYIYIYATSPLKPSGITEVIVDDFSLENVTNFDYIPSNGDFELGTGSGWSDYNTGIGSLYQTDDHTEGNKALNITSYSPLGLQSYAYLSNSLGRWNPPLGYYAKEPGQFTYSFDWKYNDENANIQTFSYFYLNGRNSTFDFFIAWFFGSGTDTILYSNYTSPTSVEVYFDAEGFGDRDIWHSFSIDLYDICIDYNLTNIAFTGDGFQSNSYGVVDAKAELLLDNLILTNYPTADPSFEEDWESTVSNPIPSWYDNRNDPYISSTTDAKSGDIAANLTSYGSIGSTRLYRYMYLNADPSLFTDFWWRLDRIDSYDYNYAWINIETDEGKEIYYILGGSEIFSSSQTNSSNDYYFFVENFNQTGVWFNLVRNIAVDFEAAFGIGNWNITRIELESYSWGVSSVTSLIMDDVHFVQDTTGPNLISLIMLNDPTYYQNALLEMMAVDTFSRVASIRVYYRTATTWSYVVATMFGMYFRASIPAHDFGNTVEYYVQMWDMFGRSSINDNGGAYYSYAIIDDIDPFVNILSISTNADYGLASIHLDCVDEGSGIEFIDILDNDSYVASIDTAPYIYNWNTTPVQESGLHVVTVIAHDFAGNTAEARFDIFVTVYEPPSPFVSFFHKWGTLVGAGIIGVAWASFSIVQFIRKPK
jgi:hypothetical protein